MLILEKGQYGLYIKAISITLIFCIFSLSSSYAEPVQHARATMRVPLDGDHERIEETMASLPIQTSDGKKGRVSKIGRWKVIRQLGRGAVLAATAFFIATASIQADPHEVILGFYSGRGFEIVKGDSSSHTLILEDVVGRGKATHISLSPDGSQIAYAINTNLGAGGIIAIYDIRRNTTKEIQFLPMVAYPRWSRDGNSIYYVTLEGNILEGCRGIYEYNLGTKRERLIVEYHKALYIQSLALSPDGRFLFYGYNEAIYKVNIHGTPKPELVVPEVDFLVGLAVGKDFLVFCDGVYPDGELYYFDLITKEKRQLTRTTMHETDPVVDGKHVYYLSRIGSYSIILRISVENAEPEVIIDSEEDGTGIIYDLTGTAPFSFEVKARKSSITTWGRIKSGNRNLSSSL